MRELDLDRLRTLVTITDLGSFAAASRALHLAPPTVSLHVAELEERVGAPLLLRSRSGVTATGIGHSLIERGRRLLGDAREAFEEARRQVEGRSGRVRLGASTGVIAHLLPRALESLARNARGIDVHITVLTSEESLYGLSHGTLDIGLIALPQNPRTSLSIRAWRRDPVRAFVPSAWAAPRTVTANWLSERPLILNDRSTQLHRQTVEWFTAAGQVPKPRIELNYNDAIKSLVAAGYGATLLPHEASAPTPDPRVEMRPLRPALWRRLAIAHRSSAVEPATATVLAALRDLAQT